VDHVVGQRDPATEPTTETVRLGIVPKNRDQLFGGAIGQVGDGDRVDAVHLQAALHEPRHLFTR
jgi:hypothetical protein